jgi:hypothetical protein
MAKLHFTFAFLGSLALGQIATAQVSINFDSLVNVDLTTFTGGSGYPQTGGTVTIAGIDYELAKTQNGKTGAMLVVNDSRMVPIGVFGVKEVYTLINITVGVLNELNGKVAFFGSGGAYQSFDLRQGLNIRDHFNGGSTT